MTRTLVPRRLRPGCLSIALGAACLPCAVLAASTGGYSVEYAGYTHGFLVLRVAGSLTLSPTAYVVRLNFRTAGLVGMVVHADNDSRAEGHFAGGQAQPSLFETSGHLRGAARVTRVTYSDENPVIEALKPPVERERSIVPVADTRHTIDTLSAAALLIRQVGQDLRCDGAVRVFDGRRLSTQTAHTAGPDLLDRTRRSIFAGQALRCDVEGQQLAGFVRNENQEDLKRPRRGTVWLADMLPNAPPVPVRLVFENKLLGQVTLYLTAVTPAK